MGIFISIHYLAVELFAEEREEVGFFSDFLLMDAEGRFVFGTELLPGLFLFAGIRLPLRVECGHRRLRSWHTLQAIFFISLLLLRINLMINSIASPLRIHLVMWKRKDASLYSLLFGSSFI